MTDDHATQRPAPTDPVPARQPDPRLKTYLEGGYKRYWKKKSLWSRLLKRA